MSATARYKGLRALPPDAPPEWKEMVPDNCHSQIPGKYRQHRLKSWTWTVFPNGTIRVWCLWCGDSERRVAQKFQGAARAKRLQQELEVDDCTLPKHLRTSS